MIKASDLIAKFRYGLEQKFGYIYGAAGVQWTAEKQKQKVQYMVSHYGENWKNNVDCKNSSNQSVKGAYNAAMYGSKWIGHFVVDCSGFFVWAFKQLSGSIYHGSNSIYDRYCTKKGKLTAALKKTIKPGTAVFTGTEGSHGHIGLYVGNGKVIEAAGTQAGVCVSNITDGKWTFYGELKGVDYSENPADLAPSAPSEDKSTTTAEPTLRKGMKGDWVAILQNKLMVLGYALPRYGADGDFGQETLSAVKAFQKANGLLADGVVGKQTWAALNGAKNDVLYTVTVKNCKKAVADEIQAKYGGTITEQKG